MTNDIVITELHDHEIDAVAGGLWMVPLLIAGAKAGLAGGGGAAAFKAGLAIGAAAASAVLAAEVIE